MHKEPHPTTSIEIGPAGGQWYLDSIRGYDTPAPPRFALASYWIRGCASGPVRALHHLPLWRWRGYILNLVPEFQRLANHAPTDRGHCGGCLPYAAGPGTAAHYGMIQLPLASTASLRFHARWMLPPELAIMKSAPLDPSPLFA